MAKRGDGGGGCVKVRYVYLFNSFYVLAPLKYSHKQVIPNEKCKFSYTVQLNDYNVAKFSFCLAGQIIHPL